MYSVGCIDLMGCCVYMSIRCLRLGGIYIYSWERVIYFVILLSFSDNGCLGLGMVRLGSCVCDKCLCLQECGPRWMSQWCVRL